MKVERVETIVVQAKPTDKQSYWGSRGRVFSTGIGTGRRSSSVAIQPFF